MSTTTFGSTTTVPKPKSAAAKQSTPTTVYAVQYRDAAASATQPWTTVGPWFEAAEEAFTQFKYLVPPGAQARVLAVAAEIIAPPPPVPVTLTSLDPATAVVGGPDLTMRVLGTGFTPTSRILWNGVEEPTLYVSETELTTTVKPSLASGPWVVPVGVTGAPVTQNFTFTAAA